jgi:hypothetical protein
MEEEDFVHRVVDLRKQALHLVLREKFWVEAGPGGSCGWV